MLMVLVIHVTIAMLGIGLSTVSVITPSRAKLRASYAAVIATIISGTYLVVRTHSSLTQACVTGLVYIGFTVSMLVAAQRRLSSATEAADIDKS